MCSVFTNYEIIFEGIVCTLKQKNVIINMYLYIHLFMNYYQANDAIALRVCPLYSLAQLKQPYTRRYNYI